MQQERSVVMADRRIFLTRMDEGMSFPDASNPIVFFKAMSCVFSLSLAAGRKSRNLIEELSRQAYESFANGIACEAQQDAAVACHGGCASCCTIRVAATAPEILNLARKIRTLPHKVSSELTRRIAGRGSRDETSRSTATNGFEFWFAPLSKTITAQLMPYAPWPVAAMPPMMRRHVATPYKEAQPRFRSPLCTLPCEALCRTPCNRRCAMQALLGGATNLIRLFISLFAMRLPSRLGWQRTTYLYQL